METNTGVKKGTLGTFAGVFTPSIMTILGIILFLRLGFVVGSAGLGRALIIIALANTISILTSVSLSAVATNLKVKGGGDYYLISRTLGVEFGGAIGIVLFLAQAVSIAFYCIGFGEALAGILKEVSWISPRLIAVTAVTCLFVLAWLGADWATKFQYVVMALLAAALLSFFMGGFAQWDGSVFAQNWTAPIGGPGFWVMFGIFFPAVTGFTQGVSMSGDLKDAGKSLPLGTFLAVGLSITVYFGVAVILAGALSREAMTNDYGAMWHVARFDFLIDAGVIAATLSSAMASFLGAPRILQSISADHIFPFLNYFAEGYGPANNPRRAVLLSLGIAFAAIILGSLNVIAPVVSMFFLVSYGLLNYATFYEAKSASPSFRPRFRWFDHRLSLAGCLVCLGTILAISLPAGAIAFSILFGIFQYLKRTAGPARWADSSRSYHVQQVREHLIAASKEPEHPRDWRPQILALSDDPDHREKLLIFASWIQGGSGLVTTVQILEGEGFKMLRHRKQTESELRQDLNTRGLKAFPLVMSAPTMEIGILALIQGYGVGPIKANTLLADLPEGALNHTPMLKKVKHIRRFRTAFRLGCNIILLNSKDTDWETLKSLPPENRRIDVWWMNDATSRLMLLLAYLMTRSHDWNGAGIRVLAVCYEKKSKESLEDLKNTLNEIRIQAEPEIVEDLSTDSVESFSKDAAFVFIPFNLRDNQITAPFEGDLKKALSRLPLSAIMLAAEELDLDAEPEEGKPGEIAEALDALEDALKKKHEVEKNADEAAKAAVEADKILAEMIESAGPGASREIMERIERAAKKVDLAVEKAKNAGQRVSKAQFKAAQIAHKAEALGVTLQKKGDDSGET